MGRLISQHTKPRQLQLKLLDLRPQLLAETAVLIPATGDGGDRGGALPGVVTREGEDDGEERRRDGQSGTGTAEVSGASAVAPGRQAEAEGDEAQREEEGDDDGEERRVDSHCRPGHGGSLPSPYYSCGWVFVWA